MAGSKIPPWDDAVVRGVADVLGHTTKGLAGSEITQLLAGARLPDVAPAASKRERLYAAFRSRQHHDQAANCVVAFITQAMTPVRYRDAPGLFNARQDQLGEVLVFAGLRITDQGQVARAAGAATLTDAAKRASSIRAELRRRGAHELVLAFCLDEVLVKDYFHASLEAVKGLAQRLRDLAGLHGDGWQIVQDALGLTTASRPKLAINSLATPSEESEQKGFAILVQGIFGMYRNPLAHDPRATRRVTDDELLELLTTLSMIHRRLDSAQRLS
jgi:uncharacterized protein (TIGR02391 family)